MKTLMVCLMILMGNVAQAQDVKDILSGVLGGSSTDGVVSNLTTVFSKSKQSLPKTRSSVLGHIQNPLSFSRQIIFSRR